MTDSMDPLFRPYRIGPLELSNRIVMAPMTRGQAPGGVLGPANVAYYRRRAEAGVGLIVTEGTWIDHPAAGNRHDVPRFHGEDALAGWAEVVRAVHEAGGRIFPQLWHLGMMREPGPSVPNPGSPSVGPSGLAFEGGELARVVAAGPPMTHADIDAVVDAYARAAADACRLGFDGIELHGAHGYLIDQFLWSVTNRRGDDHGGSFERRLRFAMDVVRECRRRTRPDFPLCLRFSQWKTVDYGARLFEDARELEAFVGPLADAGVDVFHCSTRRFWEPAFAGSELSLAGWTKRISGRATIAVGSVGLDRPHETSRIELRQPYAAAVAPPERLAAMLDRGEFDLIAVGRALLADPQWAAKVRDRAWDRIVPYSTAIREVMH